MKRDLMELEEEFEISLDLCREIPHEHDAKTKLTFLKYTEVTGYFSVPI